LQKTSNFAYRSVDCCIAIGSDMAELILHKKGVQKDKLHVIENWPDQFALEFNENNISFPNQPSNREISIGFAGNIGLFQGILDFSSIITQITNNEINFKFAGNGASKLALQDKLQNFKSVVFIPEYNREDQAKIMCCFDIGLVLLGSGMYGIGIPSKIYNLLAFGMPILFIGPKNSHVYRLVNKEGVGWAFDWDEPEKIISFLNSLKISDRDAIKKLGERSRLAAQKYSKNIAMEKFISLIELDIDIS